MYWPELEDAFIRREQLRQQSRRDLESRDLVNKIEQDVDSQFRVSAQLDRWQSIQPALEALIQQWGSPVYELLDMLSRAYWEVTEEHEKRLRIAFKLVPQGNTLPPVICWEALYGRFYYMGWFVLFLEIKADGTPIHFRVIVKDGQEWICPLDLEKLKAVLLDAFHTGPLMDLKRKPLEGLNLPVEKNDKNEHPGQ